ncbi:Nn.00g105090.m01.CDS01 [Neocucurbitaria sp. VM-36]
MRSFSRLAFLALPLFSVVFAEEPASPTQKVETSSIYASAHDAFQDLLNALPEESLQAALSGLKDFKDGVFESHHRGVEQVHDHNPALATKLIVEAVRDLQKRQAVPSNGTTPNPPQSSAQPPPQSSAAPPTSSAERPVVVPVEATTTDNQGNTIVQTTSVLSQVTASVAVTVVRTNAQGNAVTTTENRPAVIKTTTDSAGRTTVTTSAANFAPTAGEVMTATDAQGSTFLTTYTPGGGKISSVKLITTTGADGKPSTLTSYTFVDPAEATQTGSDNPTQTTGKPGLQTGAANKNFAVGYAMVGGALAFFV